MFSLLILWGDLIGTGELFWYTNETLGLHWVVMILVLQGDRFIRCSIKLAVI